MVIKIEKKIVDYNVVKPQDNEADKKENSGQEQAAGQVTGIPGYR